MKINPYLIFDFDGTLVDNFRTVMENGAFLFDSDGHNIEAVYHDPE